MSAVMFSTCGKEKVNSKSFVVLGCNFSLRSRKSNLLFLGSMKHLSILIHNKLSSKLVWIESLSLTGKRVPSNTVAIFQKKAKLCFWCGSEFLTVKRGSTLLREKTAGFSAKGCFKFLFCLLLALCPWVNHLTSLIILSPFLPSND